MRAAAIRQFAAAVALAAGLSGLGPAPARAQGYDLARVQAQDRRLATAALRVGRAAATRCPTTARRPGWTLHNLSQYAPEDRAAMRDGQGMEVAVPSVFALAADGPAAEAGLLPGDAILAVDGASLAEAETPTASFDPLRRQLDRLDAAFAAGPVLLRFRRGETAREVRLSAATVCGPRAQLALTPALSAEADDRTVSVSLGLAEFAGEEAELAFVVGHELAHVIHGDRARRLAAGGRWAEADQMAAERAADELGRDLAVQAGYAPVSAAFWTRLAAAHPDLDRPGGGHPSARERAAAGAR